MKKPYAREVVISSTPEQVFKLFQLDHSTPEPWGPEDLSAMVQHQMSAALDFDLGSVRLSQPEQRKATDSLTDAAGLDIKTFADLLRSHQPPLEILKLSQKFFKQNVNGSPNGSPEQKVAYLFYLLSIMVARTHHGVKISKLSDEELLKGIQSIMNRRWVDNQTRNLLEDGRKRIASETKG